MTQPEYLNHRKREHIKFVPKCRNQDGGKCAYTNNSCWFIHSRRDIIENEHIKDTNDEKTDQNVFSEKMMKKNGKKWQKEW